LPASKPVAADLGWEIRQQRRVDVRDPTSPAIAETGVRRVSVEYRFDRSPKGRTIESSLTFLGIARGAETLGSGFRLVG